MPAKNDPVLNVVKALAQLYAVYYFHNNKTPAQFAAMDAAAKQLSKFPKVGLTVEQIRKKYPLRA